MSHVVDNAEDSCLKNQIEPTEGVSTTSPESTQLRGSKTAVDFEKDFEKGNFSSVNNHNDSGSSQNPFPEGGLKGWLVVFGSWCAMSTIYGLINSSAVFESYFKNNQLKTYSHSEIGWIFSLYLFFVFFVGVQVGPIFDRHGPRILVALGSLCIVTSLMLLSVCTKYYQIMLAYSVLGGLGGALLNAPAYGAIAHWFDRKRGLATGIATTAGGIGGIIYPLILQRLLGENGIGFGWSCRVLGFMMLALSVPANLLLKSNPAIRLQEDGKSKTSSVWPDLTVFKDRRFALAATGVFFMEWGLFVPITFLISYSTAYGVGSTDSSTLLSLLNAGSVVGRFLPGLLADKFGRFNVIIVTITLCAATVLGLWLPCEGKRGILVAFAVTFGFSSGSNLSLIPVCLGQFCESQNYGRYFSTATMLASFGTLSSVPIAGALIEIGDRDTGWMSLIIFSGGSYLIALACYTSARVTAVGWLPQTRF